MKTGTVEEDEETEEGGKYGWVIPRQINQFSVNAT